MFESFSESSHANEAQDSFSASSSSPRSALRKEQLKEINNELIKENSLLRSQFEEAVEITAQLQSLQEKNQALLLQVGQLKAENEDLDHRLEISIATNKELNKQLNEEKKNHSQQNDTNINAMNCEIEKVKEQAKFQLDSVLEELEKLKMVHEKDVLQQKTIVGKIDRVLQSGERFFNTKLSAVDDLITHFENPQNAKPQNRMSENPGAIPYIGNSSNENIEKKMKRLKAKLRSTTNEKDELEAQLGKLQREANEIKNEFSYKVTDLQRKLSDITSDKENADSLNATKISNLEKQLEQTQKELFQIRTKERSLIDAEPAELRLIDNSNQKRQSLPEDLEKINILTHNIEDLNKHVKSQETLITSQSKKLSETEAANLQLKMQVEKMKTEIQTLKALKETSSAENETLRNALHAKQSAISEPIQVIRQPSNVVKYQKVIEEQKQKLLTANQQIDKQKKAIGNKEKEITDLQDKLNHANEQSRQLSEEFTSYRSKVESKKPITVDDILPADSFRCPEFDGQLSTCIQKIATNSSLQPASKLQSCFKAIHGHLSAEIQELQNQLDETTKENQFLSSSFNKFIIDLSIALCDQPTTIEDFFKSNGCEKLLLLVAEFRAKFDDMKHQSDRLQQIVVTLDQMFPTGIDDPVLQVNELKNQYTDQCEVLASKSTKIKRLRRELRDLIQAHENLKNDSSQKIDELMTRLNQVNSSLSQFEKSNDKLKATNSSLTSELNELRKQLAAGETFYNSKKQEEIANIVAENNKKYSIISNKYNKLQQSYSELSEEFKTQDQRFRNQDAQLIANKHQLDMKEHEINNLRKAILDQNEQFEQRLESEKQQLIDTYKGAIDEIAEQNNKYRSDVERMATHVAENEKQMAIINNECGILKKQKAKIDNDMKSLKDKVARERKLMESNFTAKRIAYETETAQKMSDERQKYEQDKRRLCTFGADAFKMFFNASSSIDEKSFRTVIENARDELTRLSQSDAAIRRIVAARGNQTTEDAVAQALMASH